MDKAQRKTRQTQQSIDLSMKGIGKSLGNMTKAFGAFAVTAGAAIAGDLIKQSLQYASGLGEVAQQLGVTTRTLQEYRYVAGQVGISQQQMDDGLAKLTRSLGEAAMGAKAPSDAFKALGVSITDAEGKTKTTDVVLGELIKAFSAIPDPAKRAALEMDLFGRSGQKLDTLLAGGVDQVDNLRNAANRLGVVLSSEQIQTADDVADKIESLQTVLSANIAGIVADNAKEILKLADSFGELVKQVKEAIKWLQWFNDEGPGKDISDVLNRINRAGSEFSIAGLNGRGAPTGFPGLSYVGRRQAAPANRAPAPTIEQRAAPFLKGGKGSGSPFLAGIMFDPAAMIAEVERMSARITTTMRELEPVIVKPFAGPQIDEAMQTLADNTQRLLDEIFPDEAERAALQQKMGDLGKALAAGLITPDTFVAARGKLEAELKSLIDEGNRIVAANDNWRDQLAGAVAANLDAFDGKAQSTTRSVAESFAAMSQDIGYSLQGLVSDINSGDWASALLGILDVVDQVAAAINGTGGGQGSGIASLFGGARANGGPVVGGKSYLVGEKGPEIFNPGRSGSIVPNHMLKSGNGGGLIAEIVPSPHYDVLIDGRVQETAGPMVAGGIAQNNRAQSFRSTRRVA